ncbi:MAG: type 4a pilus biogenesis protein PilO [Phycisphaerae bacterium]|nr:type 4a pilus biogenesis protein PilO [Phycisphaerae bacterium]
MKFGLREITFVLLLMGIPVAAWWLVFRPNNASNAEMFQQIESKQAKLQELNRATGTIGDLKKEIQSLTKAMRFLQAKLPSQKEIDKILQEVWQLAEANNLVTKSIRTQKRPRGISGIMGVQQAEQPIAVQLEGNFKGLYAFLLALENRPRIMRIHKIKISKLKNGPEGTVTADFVMSIFFEANEKGKSWSSKSPI